MSNKRRKSRKSKYIHERNRTSGVAIRWRSHKISTITCIKLRLNTGNHLRTKRRQFYITLLFFAEESQEQTQCELHDATIVRTHDPNHNIHWFPRQHVHQTEHQLITTFRSATLTYLFTGMMMNPVSPTHPTIAHNDLTWQSSRAPRMRHVGLHRQITPRTAHARTTPQQAQTHAHLSGYCLYKYKHKQIAFAIFKYGFNVCKVR